MDEVEFLRGIEGEKQNGEDLVSGAERLVRLKQQVGIVNRRDDDLEIEKKAYEITPSERPNIPKSDYAQPNKEEAGHDGKYPIPDRQHAKSALGFAKMHHDSGALVAVEKKVEHKYPDMLSGSEKDAGELSGFIASQPHPSTRCPNCRKEKDTCLCKMANVLFNARIKTASRYESTKELIKSTLTKNPTARAAALSGVTSGAVGAGMGAATTPGDRIGGAVRGGVTGTVSGAGGGALYHHLNTKLASLRVKTATSILEHAKNIHPGMIMSTGLGALAGGVGTYLASRPQKDTGKSRSEEELEGKVEAQRHTPERGLLTKMHHRNTELEHGYSKAFREHPGKAALIGTGGGGMGGFGIGQLAGAISHLRGGK